MRTSFPLLLGDGDGDDIGDGMSNEHKGSSQDREQSSGQDSSYEPSDTERLNASFELFDNDVKLEEEKNVMTSFAPTKDGSYGEYAFYVSDEDEEGTSASQPVDIWSQIDSVDILKAERQCPVKSLMSENGFIVSKFTPGEEMRGLNSPGDETNARAELGDDTKAVIGESSVAGGTCVASETTDEIAADRERVAGAESAERPGKGEDVKTRESAAGETNTENTQREVTDMDADDSVTVESNVVAVNTHGKVTDTNNLATGEVNTAAENAHEKIADRTAVDMATDTMNTMVANACVEVTDTIVVDSSNSTRECRTPKIDDDKLKTATTTTEPMLNITGDSKTNANSTTHTQEETVILGEANDSAILDIQGNENVVAAVEMENVTKVDKLDSQHVSSNKNTDKDIESERTERLSDETGECGTGGTIEESRTSDDAKSLKNGAAPGKASGSETDDDILNEPDQKQGNPTTETADMSETEDDILNVLASPQKQVKTPKDTVMSETDILNVSASSPSQKYVDPATKKADISETEDDVLLASPPSKKQVNTITKEADMSETEDVSDILNVSASTSPQTQVNPATKVDMSEVKHTADVLNVSASPPQKQVNPTTKKADRSETEDDVLNVSASSPSQKYVDPATKKAAMFETENMADVLNVSASTPPQRQVNPTKKTEMSEVKDMADGASPPSQKRANRTTKKEDTSKIEDVADVLNVSASPPQKRAKPTSKKAGMSETEDDVLLASPPSQKRVKPTTKKADMSKVKDVADVLNVSESPPSQKQVNATKSKREDSSALRDENGERTIRCGNKATSRVEGGEDVASSTDVIVIDDDETAVATSNRESTTWPPHDTVDITCETTDTDATVDPTLFPTACCSGVGPKRTGPVLAVSGLMMDDTTASTSDSYSSHGGGGKPRRRRRWRKDRRSNTHDMSQFHRHGGGGDNPGPSCSRQSGGTIDLTSDDDAMAAGDTGRVHPSGGAAFDGYCADNEIGSSDSDASTVGEWDDRDSPLFTTKRDRRASSDMDVIVVDDDTTDDCASENSDVASEHGNVASEHDTRTVPDNDKPSAAPTAIIEK